jgi:hypothetical protein
LQVVLFYSYALVQLAYNEKSPGNRGTFYVDDYYYYLVNKSTPGLLVK